MVSATSAASEPAPGVAYNDAEEARIIRDGNGLPVGIRLKMVWTWKKAVAWAFVAIVCAVGWTVLAVARGEQISAIWFIVVALCSYAIAYRFYAYYIQIKIMRTDDANATPAERVHDGANFERADRRVLFGQHFAAISGAGPLVGPILAAQMGYLPSVLWIILGVIFAGAVQDMLMLWISAKRQGRSFGQMATDEMGKFGGIIISLLLVVVTAIAMAFLALVAIKAMASSPWAVFSLGMTIPIALVMGCYERFLRPGKVIETTILGFVLLVLAIVGGGWVASNPTLAPIFTLNAKQLVVALIVYSFAAAALPHWLLVTPRDYLSTLMKIGTLALLVVGIAVSNPRVSMPGISTLASQSNGPTFSGNLFPFLFINIACGALSGFHGAVSSGLTPKAVEKENQIRMIGYGSMLVESFTAIIALIAAITISQGVYFSLNMSAPQIEATAGSAYSASASPEQNAVAAVGNMNVKDIEGNQMKVTWQSHGTTYEGAEALTRAAHDVGEESIVSRTGGATTFAIGMANFLKSYMGVSDANGGINAMVPIFGISNQLLAAGCLMLVTVCVFKKGLHRYAWIPIVPLVWDVAVTFTADFQKIFDPKLGYFAAAAKYREQIASGTLEGDALANARASLSNAYLDGALSVFFFLMMATFLVVGAVVIVNTVRAKEYGTDMSTEEPFVQSAWFAPSGLLATDLEKRVAREYAVRSGALPSKRSVEPDDSDDEVALGLQPQLA